MPLAVLQVLVLKKTSTGSEPRALEGRSAAPSTKPHKFNTCRFIAMVPPSHLGAIQAKIPSRKPSRGRVIIQINFCQIETSKMDKVPHETKYTSVWCFSLNKLEDHPLLETSHNTSVSQTSTAAVILWDVSHMCFSPIPKGPWTCVFPALTCSASRFVIFRWQVKIVWRQGCAGKTIFFEFFGFGMILITSKYGWFSPKNCGHDPFKTMPCRCWGSCICFRWPWKCLIHVSYILKSRRSVSGTNGGVHSFGFYIFTGQNFVSKAAILGTSMEFPKKKRIFKKK